jgi:hypothetical protein
MRLHGISRRIGSTQQTPVDIKGGQHPIWDAELRFKIPKEATDEARRIEVSCWASGRRKNDLLGKAMVDISQTLRKGEFDGSLMLIKLF